VQVVVEVERVVLTRGLSTLLPWELIELSNFAPACSLDPSLGGIAPAPGGPHGLQLAKYLTAEPGPEIAPGEVVHPGGCTTNSRQGKRLN
jgi:hypothetical protein